MKQPKFLVIKVRFAILQHFFLLGDMISQMLKILSAVTRTVFIARIRVLKTTSVWSLIGGVRVISPGGERFLSSECLWGAGVPRA